MIQAVITRLASQSTTIKGWCVTVTAALLGVGAGSNRRTVAGRAEEWSLDIDRPGWDEVGQALKTPAIALLYGASLLTAAAVAAYLFGTN